MSDFATFVSQAPPVSRYVGSLLIREISPRFRKPLGWEGEVGLCFRCVIFSYAGAVVMMWNI